MFANYGTIFSKKFLFTSTWPGMVASLRSSSLKFTQTVEVKLPMPPSSSSSVKFEHSDNFRLRSETGKIILMMLQIMLIMRPKYLI